MVNKKIATRDYLRGFVTKVNKAAGVNFNSSKLNSKEECEDYILNLIKDLRHKPQNNKAYIKEIDDLKEEIGILNQDNANSRNKIKKLESERIFYITQAKEAGEKREKAEKDKEYYRNHALNWNESYYEEIEKRSIISNFNIFLSFVVVLEALSIAMLIWK